MRRRRYSSLNGLGGANVCVSCGVALGRGEVGVRCARCGGGPPSEAWWIVPGNLFMIFWIIALLFLVQVWL